MQPFLLDDGIMVRTLELHSYSVLIFSSVESEALLE